MDEAVITDLKQFISATVTGQITYLEKKFETKIDAIDTKVNSLGKRMDKLEVNMGEMYQTLNTKIDNLSAYVAEALDASNEAIALQLKNHEVRITHLEQRATS